MKLYQRKPCESCPWRRDVAPGQFSVERFTILAESAWDMAIVQFACHKSPEGQEFGCAGWVLNHRRITTGRAWRPAGAC